MEKPDESENIQDLMSMALVDDRIRRLERQQGMALWSRTPAEGPGESYLYYKITSSPAKVSFGARGCLDYVDKIID